MKAPMILASVLKKGGKALANKNIQKMLFVLVGAFLLFGGVKKVRAALRKRRFNKQSTENPNRVALQFRQAANPSGINFLINTDGTDEDQFERLARKIKSEQIVKEVSDAYALKYDETLQDRAARELDNDELQRFEDIIQ